MSIEKLEELLKEVRKDVGLAAYADDNELTLEECFQTLLTGLAVRYYKAVAS